MAGSRGSWRGESLSLGARAIVKLLRDAPDARLVYEDALAEWHVVLPDARSLDYTKFCGDQLVEGGYVLANGDGGYRLVP